MSSPALAAAITVVTAAFPATSDSPPATDKVLPQLNPNLTKLFSVSDNNWCIMAGICGRWSWELKINQSWPAPCNSPSEPQDEGPQSLEGGGLEDHDLYLAPHEFTGTWSQKDSPNQCCQSAHHVNYCTAGKVDNTNSIQPLVGGSEGRGPTRCNSIPR